MAALGRSAAKGAHAVRVEARALPLYAHVGLVAEPRKNATTLPSVATRIGFACRKANWTGAEYYGRKEAFGIVAVIWIASAARAAILS